MIEITKHQEKILTLMCANVPSIYVPAKGIEAGGTIRAELDADYEDSMELVNLGLVADCTSNPAYKKQVKDFKTKDGRIVNVLTPLRSTYMMFCPTKFGISASRMVN